MLRSGKKKSLQGTIGNEIEGNVDYNIFAAFFNNHNISDYISFVCGGRLQLLSDRSFDDDDDDN